MNGSMACHDTIRSETGFLKMPSHVGGKNEIAPGFLRRRLALARDGDALQLEHDAGGRALSHHAIDLVRTRFGAVRGRGGN